HYFHAVHLPRAFHIHPLNYALGLAELAEAAGARIFEDTPALSIDTEGVRKRIATPSARVRAAHIVLACSIHLGSLAPRIAGTLLPMWQQCIRSSPTSRLSMPGRACSAMRCIGCRRLESFREAFGSPAASAATASTPRPWRGTFSPKPLSRVTTRGDCSPRSSSCGP